MRDAFEREASPESERAKGCAGLCEAPLNAKRLQVLNELHIVLGLNENAEP